MPLEGFEDKVFYVWFDATIGYVSITWAAALEASISGPGRDEGSEEAMEFAKRYSWERTATRTLEMYSAVTDGERSSAG